LKSRGFFTGLNRAINPRHRINLDSERGGGVRGSSGYRPEIDGLRAVAVLSVVLYHLQTPGFSGGFSGVDVFFVISGYLIGGHIAEEVGAGRFSLARFYARRIRRIVPALLVTLALVMLAGAAILTPADLSRLAAVAGSVLALVPNFHILQTVEGPSGAAALLSPLVHTWSLGVEEQFYPSPSWAWSPWRSASWPPAPRRSRPSICPGSAPGSCCWAP
jgi:peptidoglycan/LPS O-acetylase OafA/YrhL